MHYDTTGIYLGVESESNMSTAAARFSVSFNRDIVVNIATMARAGMLLLDWST
jgi:hypothetical protein